MRLSRTLLSALTAVTIVMPFGSVFALGGDIERKIEQRTDPCRGYEGRAKLRCNQRRLLRESAGEDRFAKLREEGTDSALLKANYQNIRLRTAERNKRNLRNAQRARKRQPLASVQWKEDHNTQRRTFLNDYREQRRACMYEPHGRPRNLCLENAQTGIQKLMRNGGVAAESE